VQVVYSEQRARLLHLALLAVQVLAGVMGVLAVWVLVRGFTGDAGDTQDTALLYAVTLLLQGGVLFTVTRWGLRRLPGRGTDARMWCLIVGVMTLLSAVPLLSSLVGIAAVFVGLFLITTAFGKDPEP